MRYIELKQKIGEFIVFNLSQIRKIERDFDLRRLSEWRDKGYIRMIRKGYYIFSDTALNEKVLSLVANKIYVPSYISLEMALSHYNLIPEGVYGITSVTSMKTNVFKTDFGQFMYRHIKPELFFGYSLEKYNNQVIKIAEPEKAVLDFLYLNPSLKTVDDFSELRVNEHELKEIINKIKLLKYLRQFNNKSLAKRLNLFLTTLGYA